MYERYGEKCVRKYTAKSSCMREIYDEACVQEYKEECEKNTAKRSCMREIR